MSPKRIWHLSYKMAEVETNEEVFVEALTFLEALTSGLSAVKERHPIEDMMHDPLEELQGLLIEQLPALSRPRPSIELKQFDVLEL